MLNSACRDVAGNHAYLDAKPVQPICWLTTICMHAKDVLVVPQAPLSLVRRPSMALVEKAKNSDST
jgi:hypothetical protein